MSLGLNGNGVASPENYARRALEAECTLASSAGRGRNDQLNRSALAIGQLVGAGAVEMHEAEYRLMEAAKASGYVQKDGIAAAKATIKSGLEAGVRNPRQGLSPARGPAPAWQVPSTTRIPKLTGVPIPDWTSPGDDGKPKFFAIGRDQPAVYDDDLRRHVYWRDGEAVRVKVKKESGPQPWIDLYRARRPSDGAIGWQARKPPEFVPVPYIGPAGAADPFAAADKPLVWAEGEKDVDTLRKHGVDAFTFGSATDVPDCADLVRDRVLYIAGDNDPSGEKGIAKKTSAARPHADGVNVIRFTDFDDGGDVTDFFDKGGDVEALLARATAASDASGAEPRDHAPGWDEDQTGAPASAPPTITAQPFVWRDPHTFPRRQWIYGHHLIRKFISCTVAPGAAGKTSMLLVEAVSLAIGRSLVGGELHEGPLRVWVLNLEDPLEELERRVIAICIHYGIDPAKLDGHLFLNSGRDTEVILATTTRDGTVIAKPVVEALTATIKANRIDVVIIDPFVAAHRVPENDNGAIDAVCKTIARIADDTNTAWDLVHHVRKGHGTEITVEDGRGAVSLLAAARSARVLNPMSKDEAERAGIDKPRGYFRMDNGKANLAPPPDRSEWYHLKGVSLDNGGPNLFDQPDYVAVVEPWAWPDAMADMTVSHLRKIQKVISESEWRENVQSKDKWVGNALAQVLRLDTANKGHRSKINGILGTYYTSGALKKVQKMDDRREVRTFVEVGDWATD